MTARSRIGGGRPAPPQPHLLRCWGRQIHLPLVEQFGYNALTRARQHPWDQHKGVELVLVVDGEVAWELADGQTYSMVGGQFSLMPPRTAHRARGDVYSPCAMFWVMYRPFTAANLTSSVFGRRDLPLLAEMSGQETTVYDGSPRLIEQCKAFRQVLRGARGRDLAAAEQAELRSLLCVTTLEACRIARRNPTRRSSIFVAKAKEYFAGRLDAPFRIEDVVDYVGFSRSRFYEMFKSETGLTPNDYVQRLRISQACESLSGSDESITSIACRMGFSDSQYFARVFRKYMGETPSDFRRRAAASRSA